MAPPPTSDDAGLVARTPQGDNAQPLTISEISALLKRTVEDRFGFVRLRGELSGVKRAASGHFYCALKDEGAVIDGVMWKGNAARMNFRAEDGLEVIATGKLTTYPGRSKYQIVIDSLELAGEGALLALLEKTRARLAAEGLFDAGRKRALPYLPQVIGVVTSPTGAVIRDILHRLADRFPSHVLVWPVLVQGQGAAEQVAAAVRGFSAIPPGGPVPRPDLVVAATGVAELLGAIGLMIPQTRKAAGWGLALYALCVWPANFQHLMLDTARTDGGLGLGYHIPRLAFQPVLIWLALWAGEATDWPFARPAGK